MAIFRAGIVLTDIRGSVAGDVFSRTAAGPIIRARTKPIYRGTERQVRVSTLLVTLGAIWKSAAMDAQRGSWETLAKQTKFTNRLGDPFTPTGFQCFVRSNSNLDLAGQSQVLGAPTTMVSAGCPFSIAYTAGVGFKVTAVGNFDVAGTGDVLIYISPGYSKTRNNYKGPFAEMTNKADTAFAALPVTIRANTGLTAGAKYTFRLVHVGASGEISAQSFITCAAGNPL